MRQWTVDAFAEAPFKGNPACVLEPLAIWPPDGFLQALAQENNASETAYLRRTADPARFDLRWFTPALEVRLCGHATLAAAAVLMEELSLDASMVTFDTLSGPLQVSRDGGMFVMDFPADPPQETPTPAGLEEALGATVEATYAARYLVALVKDETALRSLRPDIAALGRIAGAASEGPGNLVVAAKADDRAFADVVDRFFAPGSGIAEDPATGSAHCILGPLYAGLLGRPRVRFHQAFPGRGADIVTEAHGERVRIFGGARVVCESRLRLQPHG